MAFMNLYGWLNLVGLKRLELCDAKVSCTVLRGGSHSNVASLPDRYEGESIYMGENMKVTLLQIHQNIARIGIKAPKDILILREELKEKKRIQKNKRCL